PLPESDRLRAGYFPCAHHDRQFQVGRHRTGPALCPGQGGGELDLHEEGEAAFIEHAKLCRKYGAAAVVMAFDEQGQADSLERRKEICERAYRILVDQVGFPPEDIIFDPNVFAIATGIEEHNHYAVD